MRKLNVQNVSDAINELLQKACYELTPDIIRALENTVKTETSLEACSILEKILLNCRIAADEKLPLCQDTGLTVVFIDLGQNVLLTGGNLEEAVWEGVRRATKEGYLRLSVLNDPLLRKNTGDNSPGVLHLKIVPGDKIKIMVVPKGGGSENMSRMKMLNPSDGEEGVIRFIEKTVSLAGGKPCPPLVIGVGLGGTFEMSGILAKRALLREVGSSNNDPDTARLEKVILERVNKIGIGPMGFGGNTTALAVHVKRYPCHIASLPVAVNLQCHSARHREVIL
ncbi:MAG: fumarate hydratase [Candidatus Theseobacter exili]|nr:fumarate hydratase [Candidatus Theseobacter exili]